jgi:hypothetical protein
MIGKVKKWLGIEGVKLELVLPEEVKAREGLIEGKLRFQSLNEQTVNSIKVVLIERYSRGRGKEKLVDEYELGKREMEIEFDVPPEEILEVDFSLPFDMVKSAVDEFGDKNFLFGGIARAARLMRGAKSEYRIEAEASVKGVALNPFDKKSIDLV